MAPLGGTEASGRVERRPKSARRLADLALLAGSLVLALALADVAVGWIVPLRDVGPSLTQYDPVLGKRLKPEFSAERRSPEFTMRISTNALGFRGPPASRLQKGSILFLGDSFTMGYGVSDGEEYPAIVAARLRERLGDAAPPVVNAGIGDSGNGRWLKLLAALGDSMAPWLVVMQVFDNDFDDNVSERLFVPDRDGGGVRELPLPPPGFGRRFQALVDGVPGLASSNLVGLLRQVRLSRGGAAAQQAGPETVGGRLRPEDGLTLRLIEKAVLMCREKHWDVVGLLVGLAGERESTVAEAFRRHGAEVVRVPSKGERPDLYYRIDGHWNAAGHVFAADRLTPYALARAQDAP